MARPKLKPGQIGKITTKRTGKVTVARAYVRTIDDTRVEVKGTGHNAETATERLIENAKARAYAGTGEGITGRITLTELTERTIANLRAGKGTTKPLRPQSIDLYATVLPILRGKTGYAAIGNLRLVDIDTSTIHTWLETISENQPATAKRAKAILSHAFNLAMRHDINPWPVNPARNVQLRTATRKPPRFLTAREIAVIRRLVGEWQTPRKRTDLVNIIEVLIATGLRPNELFALHWSAVDLDATPATITVDATVVELEGGELLRQTVPKSDAGQRTIHIPDWCADILRAVRVNTPGDLVFPNERGGLLSRRNVATRFREAIGDAVEDVELRSFRSTLGTILERTVGLQEAARHLGHESPAITGRHYVERKAVAGDYTSVLDGYAPKESTA